MLSSVLNSPQAIEVNIAIMRTFVQMKRVLTSNSDLEKKMNDLESKYDGQFQAVFNAIRDLIGKPGIAQKRIIGLGKKEP